MRVARIFNTFGPRMHPNDGRVVSNFIIQALQGKQITIYGNGGQTRSFQFVDDLVDGLYALMNGPYDQPVNLGNPEEFTVKSFAEAVRDLTRSNSSIVHLPATEVRALTLARPREPPPRAATHHRLVVHTSRRPPRLARARDACGSRVATTPQKTKKTCGCPPPFTAHRKPRNRSSETINRGSDDDSHISSSARPRNQDDPRQRKPDITVAREHIGWAPRWHVNDGLERTIAYFRRELERSGGVIIPTGPGAAKPQPGAAKPQPGMAPDED